MSSNNHTILISVGANYNGALQMQRAKECLSKAFPGMHFTDAISSPAYGKPDDAPYYYNMLARGITSQSESVLCQMLKDMERAMGDSREQRQQGVVMMDLDLLQYDAAKHHQDDWQRPYIQRLLQMLRVIIIMFVLSFALPSHAAQSEEAELLGKAIEYFQGGKYHECIIAFEKLQKRYTLNPRFMAYLGMSYYKEQQYEDAVLCLRKCLPELQAYSPKEQAVYLYSCAESLFALERYAESIPYYDQALPFVEGNDKGDVLFHTAFAYYLIRQRSGITPAYDEQIVELFTQAHDLYKANTAAATSLQTARLQQTETMLKGMKR